MGVADVTPPLDPAVTSPNTTARSDCTLASRSCAVRVRSVREGDPLCCFDWRRPYSSTSLSAEAEEGKAAAASLSRSEAMSVSTSTSRSTVDRASMRRKRTCCRPRETRAERTTWSDAQRATESRDGKK